MTSSCTYDNVRIAESVYILYDIYEKNCVNVAVLSYNFAILTRITRHVQNGLNPCTVIGTCALHALYYPQKTACMIMCEEFAVRS